MIRHYFVTYAKRWLTFVPLLTVLLMIPPSSALERILIVPVLSLIMAVGLGAEWIAGWVLERIGVRKIPPVVAEARMRGETLRSSQRPDTRRVPWRQQP